MVGWLGHSPSKQTDCNVLRNHSRRIILIDVANSLNRLWRRWRIFRIQFYYKIYWLNWHWMYKNAIKMDFILCTRSLHIFPRLAIYSYFRVQRSTIIFNMIKQLPGPWRGGVAPRPWQLPLLSGASHIILQMHKNLLLKTSWAN